MELLIRYLIMPFVGAQVWDEVWGSILPVFQAIEGSIGFNGTLTSINNLTEALSGGNATQIIDLTNFLPDSITENDLLLFQNFVEIFDQFDESLLDEQALIDVLTDGNNSAIDDYFYDLFDEIASLLTTLQTTTLTTQTFQALAPTSTASSLSPPSIRTTSSSILSPNSVQPLQGTLSISSTVSTQVTGEATTGITTSSFNNNSDITTSGSRKDIVASILLILSSFLLRI